MERCADSRGFLGSCPQERPDLLLPFIARVSSPRSVGIVYDDECTSCCEQDFDRYPFHRAPPDMISATRLRALFVRNRCLTGGIRINNGLRPKLYLNKATPADVFPL